MGRSEGGRIKYCSGPTHSLQQLEHLDSRQVACRKWWCCSLLLVPLTNSLPAAVRASCKDATEACAIRTAFHYRESPSEMAVLEFLYILLIMKHREIVKLSYLEIQSSQHRSRPAKWPG